MDKFPTTPILFWMLGKQRPLSCSGCWGSNDPYLVLDVGEATTPTVRTASTVRTADVDTVRTASTAISLNKVAGELREDGSANAHLKYSMNNDPVRDERKVK